MSPVRRRLWSGSSSIACNGEEKTRPALCVFVTFEQGRRGAEEARQVLRGHEIDVWYSEKHIRGASQWHDEIGNALKKCDWLVVLLTPDSVKSKWVRREVHYALRSDRYEERLIPLIVKKCDVDELSCVLSGLQTITLSGRWEKGVKSCWPCGVARTRPETPLVKAHSLFYSR